MTLRGARVFCETMAASGVGLQIYVNGTAASGTAYTLVAAGTTYYYDFPDISINAADRVQLFITAADATATELSVTIDAVAR